MTPAPTRMGSIARGATVGDIKRAYRRLARKYHPDINPGDRMAAAQFRQIAEAYNPKIGGQMNLAKTFRIGAMAVAVLAFAQIAYSQTAGEAKIANMSTYWQTTRTITGCPLISIVTEISPMKIESVTQRRRIKITRRFMPLPLKSPPSRAPGSGRAG